MIHTDTILVSPFTYKNIEKSNRIDLNNSLSLQNTKESIGYKRGEYNSNTQCVKEIIGKYHGFNNENVIITSSGICLATIIGVSNEFNTIWCYSGTYPEMKDAYNSLGKVKELNSFKEIKTGDLISIETHKIPECIDNREVISEILEYAHNKKAFVLIDNSHLSMEYNPFEQFDVDFVLISLSKHSIGFNNSLVGALICNEKNELKSMFSKFRDIKSRLGFQIHPIDCYFTILGLQTLYIRMKKVRENTNIFKEFLKKENIKFNSVDESGVFFIKVDNKFNSNELYNLDLFNVADTFGANYSVFKHWEDLGYIRISLGIENGEDLIECFKNFIPYLKAHLI